MESPARPGRCMTADVHELQRTPRAGSRSAVAPASSRRPGVASYVLGPAEQGPARWTGCASAIVAGSAAPVGDRDLRCGSVARTRGIERAVARVRRCSGSPAIGVDLPRPTDAVASGRPTRSVRRCAPAGLPSLFLIPVADRVPAPRRPAGSPRDRGGRRPRLRGGRHRPVPVPATPRARPRIAVSAAVFALDRRLDALRLRSPRAVDAERARTSVCSPRSSGCRRAYSRSPVCGSTACIGRDSRRRPAAGAIGPAHRRARRTCCRGAARRRRTHRRDTARAVLTTLAVGDCLRGSRPRRDGGDRPPYRARAGDRVDRPPRRRRSPCGSS